MNMTKSNVKSASVPAIEPGQKIKSLNHVMNQAGFRLEPSLELFGQSTEIRMWKKVRHGMGCIVCVSTEKESDDVSREDLSNTVRYLKQALTPEMFDVKQTGECLRSFNEGANPIHVTLHTEPTNDRYNETSARRRKHLTSSLKRAGFKRDQVIIHPTEGSQDGKNANRFLKHTEVWSKISGHEKQKLTFNKFDTEHRDIVRDLLRDIKSLKLSGAGNAFYTKDFTFLYETSPHFESPHGPRLP